MNRHHCLERQCGSRFGRSPRWPSEIARNRVGHQGTVVGIDLLPLEPIQGVSFLQGDFTEPEQVTVLKDLLNGKQADVVMSDMAPNISGIPMTDQLRMIALAEQALDFSLAVLQPKGAFVVKLFHGVGFDAFVIKVRQHFVNVRIRKPKASKSQSKEVYLSARNFRAIMRAQ